MTEGRVFGTELGTVGLDRVRRVARPLKDEEQITPVLAVGDSGLGDRFTCIRYYQNGGIADWRERVEAGFQRLAANEITIGKIGQPVISALQRQEGRVVQVREVVQAAFVARRDVLRSAA